MSAYAAAAGWGFLGVEGKHAIWCCRTCRRKAITPSNADATGLGRCPFCFPSKT